MNITIEGIKNLRLPLPPRELQDEIVQEANNLRAESDRLREEADAVVSNAKEHVERLLLGEVSLT
jgi:restriction endonuclease S subunit